MKLRIILYIMLYILCIVSCREGVITPEDIEPIVPYCFQIKWNPDVYQCTSGDSTWFERR